MYNCKKCNFSSENASLLANHYKYSHSLITNCTCDKCNKVFKSIGGLKCHYKSCSKEKTVIDHICPKCGNYIKSNIKKHINYCDGSGTRKQKNEKNKIKIKIPWSKGLTKENNNSLKKLSDTLKLKYQTQETIKHTDKTKKLLSEIILERYKNGWQSTAGRCKKLDYHSEIAGDIKVDGGWELATAKYLDSINVNWVRNKKRFKYWNSIKNMESTYCPDFFVIDWNKYIEVKGYKTELDEIKWTQFEEKLEVWDKNKLKSLGIKAKWL